MNNFYNNQGQNNEVELNICDDDFIENQLDPYDNSTGEKQFCNGYSEKYQHVISRSEKSILPDLKSYPDIPEDIKNQADVVYNKMRYQVRRGKIRIQMLFFCVYCAYLEKGKYDIIPTQLGAIFKLTPGEVQKCDSIFSPLQIGYRPPLINVLPTSYLPEYCKLLNLSQDTIDDVMRKAVNILNKNESLLQEHPQTVAAGLLKYYMVTAGIIIDDPTKLHKTTFRSNVAIDSMYKRICVVDNN